LRVYVFVDVSRDGGTVYSAIVVQAEKLGVLGSRLSWVKHRRKMGRRRRRGYDPAFLRRLKKLISSGLIIDAVAFQEVEGLKTYLLKLRDKHEITAAYLDEYVLARLPRNLLNELPVKPEAETTRKRGDLRRAMLLADGLAGIAREKGIKYISEKLGKRPRAAP